MKLKACLHLGQIWVVLSLSIFTHDFYLDIKLWDDICTPSASCLNLETNSYTILWVRISLIAFKRWCSSSPLKTHMLKNAHVTKGINHTRDVFKSQVFDIKTDIQPINIYSYCSMYKGNMQYTGHILAIFSRHNTNIIAYCNYWNQNSIKNVQECWFEVHD